VSNLRPCEGRFWGQFVLFLIDVEPQSGDSQPQLGVLLITDEKIVDTIHVQILGYLQVFHLSLIS